MKSDKKLVPQHVPGGEKLPARELDRANKLLSSLATKSIIIHLVMGPDTTMTANEFVSISYDMADVLAEDIGDDLNMQVRTCDREHRGMDGFSILRGEYCEEYISNSLESTVFESYVGEYW